LLPNLHKTPYAEGVRLTLEAMEADAVTAASGAMQVRAV